MKNLPALSGLTVALLSLCACAAADAPSATEQAMQADSPTTPAFPSNLPMPTIYEGADGKTHFRDDTVALAPGMSPLGQANVSSATKTATNTKFIVEAAHAGCNVVEPHSVTSRRFAMIFQGTVELTTGDGEARVFKRGDMLEMLDMAPSAGHRLCVLGDEQLVMFFSNHD